MTPKTSQMLQESRGFAARKSGDSFVNPKNRDDLATYNGLELLPEDKISYDTNADFVKAYTDWKQAASKDSAVYELNTPLKVIRAAFIVDMDTPRGSEKFVLFTKDLKNLEGKLTSIPPHVIDPNHGGYVLNRATSLSERSGLKPSEVLSGKRLLTPKEVAPLLDVARSTAGDEPVQQMQDYLSALADKKGKNFTIKGGSQFASLHQKYLGEWAAPIALITSQFEPVSQLPDIQDEMTDGKPVRTGKIRYNTDPTEALFDSAVVVDGMEILISSKAAKGGGAAASLKGIQDTITKNIDEFPTKFWSDPKHSKFRKIVDTIMDNSAIDGVLKLAVEENIMPQSDVSKIQDAIKDGDSDVPFTVKTQRLMGNYAANENHPQYNRGKHALASVARAVSNKFNSEGYTGVAKAILAKSNVVQMMFATGVKGPDLLVKGFELVWPPEFEGEIKFYPGKAFSATEIKGRLGFKISKFKDAEEPDESLQAPSISKVDLAKRKQEAELKVGKIVTKGERDKRDTQVSDEVALGRSKKSR
jgi:hypothetical protein